MTGFRSMGFLCVLFVLTSGCGGDTAREPEATGTASFALRQAMGEDVYRLIGTFRILDASSRTVDTLVAEVDGPASHTFTLPIGTYTLELEGAAAGDLLRDDGTPPYCTHEGPREGFTGCTLEAIAPFTVRAGQTTIVPVPVRMHFEDDDVLVLFRTGTVEVTLDPTEGQATCGEVLCGEGEVCATVEGIGPACHRTCESDDECPAETACIATAASGGDGTGSGSIGLCMPAVDPEPVFRTTAHRITNVPGAQHASPQLGRDDTGLYVVFVRQDRLSDGRLGPGHLFVQRLDETGAALGSASRITEGVEDNQLPSASGSRIVWTAFASLISLDSVIRLHDLSRNETRDPLGSPTVGRYARIDRTNLVWLEGTNPALVMLYDLEWGSGLGMHIGGGGTLLASGPAIGSRYVVWEQRSVAQPDRDVVSYDMLMARAFAVSRDLGIDERSPATDGNWFVWEERDTASELRIRARR